MKNRNRNNQTEDNHSKLSDGQKQRMKKYAVFAFMGIVCAGCIRFIFAPSAEEKAGQEAQRGFNTEIPDPKNAGIVGDKAAAYEQEQMKQKQVERMRSLEDFSSLPGESDPRQADDLALSAHEPAHTRTSGGISPGQTAVQNSVDAYRDLNRTLGNFYEKPREDPEKEKLKLELEELKLRMDESENRKRTADEQPALPEKSFQMASGYLPATPETGMETRQAKWRQSLSGE